jgi:tRNA G18 (ribose-2'-O)-methylase SpoU
LFIAEGRKVVERLVNSPYHTESILVSDKQRHYLPPEDTLGDTPVFIVPQSLAEQLVGYNFHAGILGCGRRRDTAPLEQLWNPAASSLLVAGDRLTDPDNLGALIRLCAGFGVSGLLLGPGCADPFSRRALRVSMGNLLNLPVRETANLTADLHQLRAQGMELLGAALQPTAIPLATFQRRSAACLLLGNESDGLSEELLALCDEHLIIPMSGQTDSLNVSVAAGIMLYELTQEHSAQTHS